MKRITTMLVLTTALVTGGCARTPGHQGFISDMTLIDGIKAGLDNRESVEKTLGRPSFIGQFDQRDWYYIARETKQLAFAQPRPVAQMILHVRFDQAGRVASVDRSGLEHVAMIHPIKDKTPTLGRDRSLLEDLFGNIGQVGSVGGGGSTADNPDGGGN